MIKSTFVFIFILSSLNIDYAVDGYKVSIDKASRGRQLATEKKPNLNAAPRIFDNIDERPFSSVVYTSASPYVTKFGKWADWQYCPGVTFLYFAYIKLGRMRETLADKDFSFDSPGVKGMLFSCLNVANTSLVGRSLIIGDFNVAINGTADCGNTYIKGIQLQNVANQGCQDDYGTVNLKLICAKSGDNELILYKDKGRNIGDWTRPLMCPKRSAACGVRELYSATGSGSYNQQTACFENEDATGIDGIELACCSVPNPAYECFAEAGWETLLKCTSDGCPYKSKQGMWYLPTSPLTTLKDIYDHIGFSAPEVIDTLLENYEGTIGEEFEGHFFFTFFNNQTLPQTETQKFQNGCNGKEVQQLILTCDYFQMRTEVHRCK